MLYYIDSSIVEAVAQQNDSVVQRLDELLYCWKRGLCILDSCRRNLDRLIALGGSMKDFSAVKAVKQGIHNIYSDIDFFIVLTNGNANPQLDADLSKKAALLEITSISGVFNFAINFVVCENVRDYDLYKWGTDSLVKALKDIIFNLNIMPYNGGGSTIVDSVRHLNGFNKLLITDSDKKYASCPKGSTDSLIQQYIRTERPDLCWSYTLIVHEVENLLPFEVIENVTSTVKYKIKKLNIIKDDAFGNTFLIYFDFKNGFRCSHLRLIRKNENTSLGNYKKLLSSIGISEDRIKKALKMKYDKNTDNELVCGFGDSILPDCLTYISSHDNVNLNILDYQKEDWGNISRKIWSLGCAMKPKRN